MSHSVDDRLNRMLDQAQRNRSCLAARSKEDKRALLRRVERGTLVSPHPNLFARKEYWLALSNKPDIRDLHVVRGFATLNPNAIFAQVSAALIYGLQVTGSSLGKIHLATDSTCASRTSSDIVRHQIPHREIVACHTVGPLRVTSLWRTVFDCLKTLPAREALVVADSVARKMHLDAWQIQHILRCRFSGSRGLDRALEVARFADGRSENGGESIARANIVHLGFETPELQAPFIDPVDGRFTYRVDFLWSDADMQPLVIGELDGYRKTEDQEYRSGRTATRVLADERRRESRLTAHGVPVMRMSFQETLDQAFLERLLNTYRVPRRQAGRTWTHTTRLTMADWHICIRLHVPKRPLVSISKHDLMSKRAQTHPAADSHRESGRTTR